MNSSPFLAPAEDSTPLCDINTTPLIDVMLVLLIALIVTMPPLTHATKVDMPSGVPGVELPSVAIEIDFDGTLLWNDTALTGLEQLQSYLRTAAAKQPQPIVKINANRRAAYDTVAQVLAATQRGGIRSMGLVGNERFRD
jgi:biopolymer transport protein ExbD